MTKRSPKTKLLAGAAAMMFVLGIVQLAKGHSVAALIACGVGVVAAAQATYFWRKYRS